MINHARRHKIFTLTENIKCINVKNDGLKICIKLLFYKLVFPIYLLLLLLLCWLVSWFKNFSHTVVCSISAQSLCFQSSTSWKVIGFQASHSSMLPKVFSTVPLILWERLQACFLQVLERVWNRGSYRVVHFAEETSKNRERKNLTNLWANAYIGSSVLNREGRN